MGHILFGCFLLLLSVQLLAAIPHKQATEKKMHEYLDHGLITGGTAGDGFSLLNIRSHFSKESNIERVVFDLGNLQGQPLLNKVSYFTVSLERAPARIVIDLAQVQKSGVDAEKIKQVFAKSPFVADAAISFDPEDLSTTVLLTLKEKVEIEVFKLPSKNKASRMVLDLRAQKGKDA